jgi:hypothetical protein
VAQLLPLLLLAPLAQPYLLLWAQVNFLLAQDWLGLLPPQLLLLLLLRVLLEHLQGYLAQMLML